MYFTQRSSIRRRFYAHADVEGAGGGRAATRSGRQVGGYNADSLLRLGKGPIGAGTADRLVESGQADARAKNGQVYLTPSVPKTAAAPRLDLPTPAAARTETETRSTQGKRFGDIAADEMIRSASARSPLAKTLFTADKYTGNTLRNMGSSVIGESASNAVNLGGTALDAAGAPAGQKLYGLSDRLYQESEDSLNDALRGKSELGQSLVRGGVKLGKAGGQAAANLAVPGLGTGLRAVDEAGRSSREYRLESGTDYDPKKALTRATATGLGVVGGDALSRGIGGSISDPWLRQGARGGMYALTETAFDETGRALTEDGYAPDTKRILNNGVDAFAFGYIDARLQDSVLSARDKAAIHDDLADAQKSCDAALKTLSDPNATAEERSRAIQKAIHETDWARYRLNDVDAFGTQSEIGEAYDKLTDTLETLRGYETRVNHNYELELGTQDGLVSAYKDAYNEGRSSLESGGASSSGYDDTWQFGGSSTQMPNYADAITPREKFVNYSLDYKNENAAGKAEAFERGLGYTKENADDLINQIHRAVSFGKILPYDISISEYGTKYKFRIPVTGPNGNTKNVIAVYQIDKGSTVPRLITNYVEGK